MTFSDRIKGGIFAFDKGDDRFELNETESGEPPVFGKRRPVGAADTRADIPERIPRSIEKLQKELERRFSSDVDHDLIMRRFLIAGRTPALVVFMNGMADDAKVNEFLLRPLIRLEGTDTDPKALLNGAVEIAESATERDLSLALDSVLGGMTAVFIEGQRECILSETRGFEKRAVEKAENEQVVRGPKEGFTESLRTNITLIRRILCVPDLVVRQRASGGRNNVKLAVIWRRGVTDERLLAEVERRLDGVDLAAVTSSGMLEQMTEDCPLSPIPQMLSTERPDRAALHVMRGRVCIILDGCPQALILPVTFFTLMDSPEDIYMRRPLGTVLRVVRFTGAVVSVLLPGYFLALALYHQGVLSTEVLSTVIASRRMVFEPIGVEMLILLLIFQMIREAGQRVPGSIGQAIGIIGGLVMGQAAVTANLASSVVLIIVAASGLGNFCVPDYPTQIAASYLRLAIVIAAWLGGLLGIVAAALLAVAHAAGLKSFGVPFLAPFAPRTFRTKPLVLRGPLSGQAADDELNTAYDRRIRRREQ
ncbi:MAG: spore germination protein [Clostridia bacterium]|nr:spore germination protein [Clostridia bacterium]